jgi:hypothetical protein
MAAFKSFSKIIPFLILILAITNCDRFSDFESGPPEQIVIRAEKFYKNKNAEKFAKLYSEKAIKKLDHSLQALRHQFKTLDPQYRQDLAEKMSLDPNSLTNLKMTDYILFNMNIKSEGMGSDNIIFPVDEVVEQEFIGTEIIDSKALVKYKNATIHLVQEKDHWKIETFTLAEKQSEGADSPE